MITRNTHISHVKLFSFFHDFIATVVPNSFRNGVFPSQIYDDRICRQDLVRIHLSCVFITNMYLNFSANVFVSDIWKLAALHIVNLLFSLISLSMPNPPDA